MFNKKIENPPAGGGKGFTPLEISRPRRLPLCFRRGGSLLGFTLLEVIGAIFIFSIGILAVYRVIPSVLSSTTLNSSRVVAAYLSQEGIEIVRNIRDGNWLENNNNGSTPLNEGLTSCTSGCTADYAILGGEDPYLKPSTERALDAKLKIDSSGFYKYDCPGCNQTKFARSIAINDEGESVLKVTVDVFWNEKGKIYHFVAQEKLYPW